MSASNCASITLNGSSAPPAQLAIALPSASGALQGPQISFGELRQRIAEFQRGIDRSGLRPGDRVVMLSPVSIDFYALALALWGCGQVLVFLDGRLDRRRFLRVLAAAQAQAIVSVRPLLRLWPIMPPLWKLRRFVSDAPTWGAQSLDQLLVKTDQPPTIVAPKSPDQSALISFTSGSTGRPKGADRTHAILLAQHDALQAHAPGREGEIDMPCFPAVVLHNLSCGISSVVPPIDLRHPGQADPARVTAAISHYGVQSLSGAPAYMQRLCDHLLAGGVSVPSVRRVYVGGAPVSRRLGKQILAAFPSAAADAVYGSTEAEPMAAVSLQELVATPGEGFLVGHTTPPAEIELVDLPELAPSLGPTGLVPHRVAPPASGEVVVRGPHVNRLYIGDDEANRRFKIPAGDGSVWHRTHDLARRDKAGRLWLTGRVPDRVNHHGQVLLPFVLEAALLDAVPELSNVALIAHGSAPEGELVYCCADSAAETVRAATQRLLAEHSLDRLPARRIAAIPTDARHNSKIDRPALREQLAADSARSGGGQPGSRGQA
ncbi:MAG TPA: AMP-binding protein [Pseudomonadota bacterium]|nr:AMP-binding protein [Pseudomonadota bacterium]